LWWAVSLFLYLVGLAHSLQLAVRLAHFFQSIASWDQFALLQANFHDEQWHPAYQE
jgi:hypothetical protein